MIDLIGLSQNGAAALTLAVVGMMFILFVRVAYPTEVVAMGGVALLLVLGLLPYEEAVPVLANPAPWTIAAMFIVMGALVRTGALDAFTQMATRHTHRPRLAIAALMVVLAALAAFVILHRRISHPLRLLAIAKCGIEEGEAFLGHLASLESSQDRSTVRF